jgi:hypothetical protein
MKLVDVNIHKHYGSRIAKIKTFSVLKITEGLSVVVHTCTLSYSEEGRKITV